MSILIGGGLQITHCGKIVVAERGEEVVQVILMVGLIALADLGGGTGR